MEFKNCIFLEEESSANRDPAMMFYQIVSSRIRDFSRYQNFLPKFKLLRNNFDDFRQVLPQVLYLIFLMCYYYFK